MREKNILCENTVLFTDVPTRFFHAMDSHPTAHPCMFLPSGEPALASSKQPLQAMEPRIVDFIERHISAQHTVDSHEDVVRWRHVAKRINSHQPLSIAVLGVSVTAGCGSEEPWAGYSPSGTNNAKCSLPNSWTRRLTEELQRLLHGNGSPRCDDQRGGGASSMAPVGEQCAVRTAVAFKNAVSADYFATCTSSFLPANASTDLILLDVATNDWGSQRNPAAALEPPYTAQISSRIPS